MKIKHQTSLILLFLCHYTLSFAQQTINLKDPIVSLDLNATVSTYRSPQERTIHEIKNLPDSLWKSHKIGYGISNDNFWIKGQIKNTSQDTKSYYLLIDNHHLNGITLYQIEKNLVVDSTKTGDNLPFHKRAVNHRKFLFPFTIAPNSTYSFITLLDNKGTSMIAPFYLWDKLAFHTQDYTYTLQTLFIICGLSICFAIALLSALIFKKKLLIWYTLYVSFMLLFILGDSGFLFQYITGKAPLIHTYMRICLPFCIIAFLIKLTQNLYNLKTVNRKLFKTSNLLFIGAFSYAILDSILAVIDYTIPLVTSFKYIYIIVMVVTLVGIAIKYYSTQKRLSQLYILAFTPVLLTIIVFSLKEMNVLNIELSAINTLYFSALFESLVLGLSVIYISKKQYDKLYNIRLRVLKVEKEVANAFIEGVEKERERLSRQLHDDIGSSLCIIKNNSQNTEVKNSLESIINDVRQLSHDLSPDFIVHLGFENAIKSLIEKTFAVSKIKISFQAIGEPVYLLSEKTQLNLYRVIQEILINILKHSEATTIDFQIFNYDNELVITIEDNGKGFDKENLSEGLGLINIKKRIEYINGSITIDTQPLNGFSALIKVPF